jgi:hypothetical protein
MKIRLHVLLAAFCCAMGAVGAAVSADQSAVSLPPGVKAVWDLSKAYRETTSTRERICINGLWRWQPSEAKSDQPPTANWGYFKVPGCWPGISDYMQNDCQAVYAHPSWKDKSLGAINAVWYQREITVPKEWAGRRIALCLEYLNSFAAVYVDGKKSGETYFPAGEVDLTSVCRPGSKHVLSMLVVAMPLKAVMLALGNTNVAEGSEGPVLRRGLCGDVYLVSTPAAARIGNIRVDTSVRNWKITFNTGLLGLAADAHYSLRAQVTDNGRKVAEFASKPLGAGDLKDGRVAFTESWKPEKLWDGCVKRATNMGCPW